MRLQQYVSHSTLGACLAAVVLALSLSGCASGKKDAIPTGITEVDKFLFEKGTEALNKKRWLTAREYFMRIVDNYPQSPFRPDAKLGVGDTYLGEGTAEGYVLAESEFKEFLTFFPTHPRADYAQYKLGMVHFAQMRGPERDQSETRQAVNAFETFVTKYPNSKLLPEVEAKLRIARDRLSESEYQVGYFYYKQGWYPGAIERFKKLLKDDPLYSNRDAVYFYLGESLMHARLQAEALPYYDRLVREFETSEYLERAKQRIAEYQPIPSPSGEAKLPGAAAPTEAPVSGPVTPPPAASPAPPAPLPQVPPPQ